MTDETIDKILHYFQHGYTAGQISFLLKIPLEGVQYVIDYEFFSDKSTMTFTDNEA